MTADEIPDAKPHDDATLSKPETSGDSAGDGAAPKPTTLEGLRIVLVEDSKLQRRFTAKMLTELGADVDEAEDGTVALAVLRTAAFNDMPHHLVLTDLYMPRCDGQELLRRIRLDTGLRTMPVVVLSNESEKDKILQCASLGISSFLHKPATKSVLRRVLLDAVACSARLETDDAPVSAKSAADLKRCVLNAAQTAIDKGESLAARAESDRVTKAVLDWLILHSGGTPESGSQPSTEAA